MPVVFPQRTLEVMHTNFYEWMSLHLFTLKQNLIHQNLCHERYTCLPVFVRTDLSVLRVKLLHSKLEAPRDSPVNQSSNPVFTINDVWDRLCQVVYNLITRFEGESVYKLYNISFLPDKASQNQSRMLQNLLLLIPMKWSSKNETLTISRIYSTSFWFTKCDPDTVYVLSLIINRITPQKNNL